MSEPLSPEGYAAAGGDLCPACGSEEVQIEMDVSASDFRSVVQVAECLSCGATWKALYVLTGYSDLIIQEEEDEA